MNQRALMLAAFGAVSVLLAVSLLRWLPADPLYADKVRAAEIMREGVRVLGQKRQRSGLPWNAEVDPNRTGLIGRDYTDLTTTLGLLSAKRTATNPNFAGVVVALLAQAGVKRGDMIAVNFSGSFPALNLAVMSAARAMELYPVVISSTGASSFGANEADWTWLDQERILQEKGVIMDRSVFASLGGIVDGQGGLDGTGLELGREAIRRNGVPFLDEGGAATFQRDVTRRMGIYLAASHGRPAAFVNVGGTRLALGMIDDASIYPPGLITKTPGIEPAKGGLMARMAARGVPVIHLLQVRRLAEQFGLPIDPQPLPDGPEGTVMRPYRHARVFACGGLLVLGLILIWTHRNARH